MNCFQNEASVEAPSEGAKVAWEMFGRDGAVGGQEAVFDVGEHGICPAEGGVTGGGAVGAGDMALVDDARLPRNALKPLPAVADDGGPGLGVHSRLVSAVWNPRTTCNRAYRGRPSAVVSTAMIKGVWPRRPRPEPSPVRSPPI